LIAELFCIPTVQASQLALCMQQDFTGRFEDQLAGDRGSVPLNGTFGNWT